MNEHELVIIRDELDALHDDMYVLACAVDDTERDLAEGGQTVKELREMVNWLMAAARPLRDRELRPGGAPRIPS